MKTKTTFLIFFASGSMLFQSCIVPLYAPNPMNVPTLTKKNEVNLSAGYGDFGTHFQAAYATGNHFGIQMQYMTENDPIRNEKIYDVGVGYFETFGKHGIFEIFGGPSFGTTRTFDYGGSGTNSTFSRTRSADIFKFNVQPDVGVKAGKVLEFIYSTRISYLSLYNIDRTDGYSKSIYHDGNLDGFLIEPAVTLRLGYKNVMFFSQLLFSLSSNDKLANENEGGSFIIGTNIKFK